MGETYVMEVIRTTTRRGWDTDAPIHKHIQYYSTDGELLAEECNGGYCDE